MDPRRIAIDEYEYTLPDERIAVFPKPVRDQSRLLIYNREISEDVFRNIPQQLPGNSLVVFNNSRVVEARLVFNKPTGAAIEIFCLEPDERYSSIDSAFAQTGKVYWKCLVGNASAWTSGLILEKSLPSGSVSARLVERRSDHFIIQLSWTPENTSFAEMLHLAGAVPLPPYIKRKPEKIDNERYQTIYARHSGSVAAPTAGLHFTEQVLHDLAEKNIQSSYVTLHVGAGTFKPVKSKSLESHEMHSEVLEVKKEAIEQLITHTVRPVIAVGTTSLRTLESLYWLGAKLLSGQHNADDVLEVRQWDPYDIKTTITAREALSALLYLPSVQQTGVLIARTSLLIAPSYLFRIVDILVTNFHQPRSTLLLLVAAFIGDDWRRVYQYALDHDFRFLSYGDSCLLFKQQPSL